MEKTLEALREEIRKLVDKFERDKYSYLSKGYMEAQVRKDFIDPFFKAIGWDIENEAGLSPFEREVILEKGETEGRPDYNFRVDGMSKFYVEAKAPSEHLDNVKHILQAKSYAWNTKEVFIAVLTDFEELRVYDASIKPNHRNPNLGLIYNLKYTEYLNNLDKLWTLSKKEVATGSLDKLLRKDAESRRQRIPVDRAFLSDMTEWREKLAKDLYKRNPEINVRVLNDVVQRILDRFVFIRIAEDRKILEPKTLLELAELWKSEGKRKTIQSHLNALFRKINSDLNGEIFKPHACEQYEFDSALIAEIIEALYPPDCPYRFDVIGVELLGSIYERYLGKTIRLTAQRVKVEDKPEVRKAGGVYYTPKFIVDYIVDNTVGRLIEGKTPKEMAEIKILDPACGSGSFLLAAFQKLIDYHIKYYTEHPEEAGRGTLFPNFIVEQNGTRRLSIVKKGEILRNSIFGVDIDPQAVEITMMSLYIKALEGERSLPENKELLPSLANNIKCGNSLIGYDIYAQQKLFEDDEKVRINAFDWKSKSAGFGDIMERGGFDAVIGNPPWGAEFSDMELDYLRKKHREIIVRMTDSYMFFIHHSSKFLLDPKGIFGMIIPSTLLTQADVKLLRQFLIEKFRLRTVINLGEKVFDPKVLNTSTILVFSTSTNDIKTLGETIIVGDFRHCKPDEKPARSKEANPMKRESWLKLVLSDPDCTYFTLNLPAVALFQRLSNALPKFQDILDGEIQRGITPDYFNAHVIENKVAKKEKIEKEILRPVALGEHISKYGEVDSSVSIIYLTRDDDIRKYPSAKKHLEKYKDMITCPEVAEGKHPWFALHRPRCEAVFKSPKFIGLTTTKKICIALDESANYYATDALYLFKLKPNLNIQKRFVLGVLHSACFQFLYQVCTQGEQRVIPQIKATKLYGLPFPIPDLSDPKEKSLHDEIVTLVDRMLDLNKKKSALPPSAERERIEREIAVTDEMIDKLVYELYGITEEEIKIIEGTAKVADKVSDE